VTEECIKGFPLNVSIFIRGKPYRSVDHVKYFFKAGASAQMDSGLFVGVAEAAKCGLVLEPVVSGDSAV
jgi:hypothetical protein